MEASVTSYTIIPTDSAKPYAVYDVQVKYKGQEWVLKKRYSEFFAFRKYLDRFDATPALMFPEKKSNSTDPTICILRVSALDSYIKAVVGNLVHAKSLELALFLEIYVHVSREPRQPKVLIPLPDIDFDPTEVSVPWKLMTLSGFNVIFATEKGAIPQADPLLIREGGVVLGQLGASPQAKQFYAEMIECENYKHPITWDNIVAEKYDGLLLPGGHAPGMKQYLESNILQGKIVEYFHLNRPVAAICHGVLLAARSTDPETGKSVLYGKKTTSLPKYMEQVAYGLTFWKLGKYYRTYEAYCADEVCSFLQNPEADFVVGPPLGQGSLYDDTGAHVVQDKLYISGRYPGDAYLFGKRFITLICTWLESANA